MVKHRIALVLAAATLVACASTGSTGSSSSRPGGRSDVITTDQMRETQATNLYEAVQIFMGGQHVGGTDMLRQLPLTEAGSLHFYTAAQAESKFGTGYPNGVIEILPPGKQP